MLCIQIVRQQGKRRGYYDMSASSTCGNSFAFIRHTRDSRWHLYGRFCQTTGCQVSFIFLAVSNGRISVQRVLTQIGLDILTVKYDDHLWSTVPWMPFAVCKHASCGWLELSEINSVALPVSAQATARLNKATWKWRPECVGDFLKLFGGMTETRGSPSEALAKV